MKKLLFVAVLGLIALTSCSKEKTCTCTTAYTGDGASFYTPVSTSVTIKDGDCEDMNTTATASGLTQTMTCVEK